VLELSLFGGDVTYTEMARNVIHRAVSHSLVKDLVEKGARLFVVRIWVCVGVSSNWSDGFLGVDSILLVFLWTIVLCWFVVRCTAVATEHIHSTVTLVISGS